MSAQGKSWPAKIYSKGNSAKDRRGVFDLMPHPVRKKVDLTVPPESSNHREKGD